MITFAEFIYKPMLKKLLCFFLLCPLLYLYGCNDSGGNNTSTNEDLCLREQLSFDPVIFQQNGFHLFVIGDTGTGDNNQQNAADSLESYHLNYPLDGIIHTGDIFYPNGLDSADHDDTYSKFTAVYQGISPLPWYLVAGNHEHDGSIQALTTFAAGFESLHFPGLYYLKTLAKAGINWQVNLLATDTTPFTFGLVQAGQLAWLQNQLSARENQLNLVIGHHPIFSNGTHGDTEELQGSFYRLLQQYRVPLYLSGHEHNLQLLASKEAVNFLVSGGGGAGLSEVSCGDNLYANKSHGGFALFISRENIYVIPVTLAGPEIMFSLPLEQVADN
ncbi:metallophosphoesterase [Thalassomonas haliotis]|uniref:Metallophosphoesterase n=1 Tax=Thalassomonas haliotis TaxID=485448 RepID=A0ABY7VBC2_9GAMM|nr:metallophosphoesterase [Thalassomonas haliotis]WDE10605.1 metallophosphoesterase [Thalassomonas haliotis]